MTLHPAENPRTSTIKARPLEQQIILGFERRLLRESGLGKPSGDGLYRELVEIRAIGRELIAHVNHLEGRE
jgi:hypothetical protein